MVRLRSPAQRLAERRGADRHQHELLKIDGVTGVHTAVQDVEHGDGQACALVPPIDRNSGRSRSSATALALARDTASMALAPSFSFPCQALPSRSIMVKSIPRWSIASKPSSASAIDRLTCGDRLSHSLATEAVPTVSELDRLVYPGRSTRGSNGSSARAPRSEDHLGFDRRVAARIEDFSPHHVFNGAHNVTPSVPALVGHRGHKLVVHPPSLRRPQRWRQASGPADEPPLRAGSLGRSAVSDSSPTGPPASR